MQTGCYFLLVILPVSSSSGYRRACHCNSIRQALCYSSSWFPLVGRITTHTSATKRPSMESHVSLSARNVLVITVTSSQTSSPTLYYHSIRRDSLTRGRVIKRVSMVTAPWMRASRDGPYTRRVHPARTIGPLV